LSEEDKKEREFYESLLALLSQRYNPEEYKVFDPDVYAYLPGSPEKILHSFSYRKVVQPRDVALSLLGNIQRLLKHVNISSPMPPLAEVVHQSKKKFVDQIKQEEEAKHKKRKQKERPQPQPQPQTQPQSQPQPAIENATTSPTIVAATVTSEPVSQTVSEQLNQANTETTQTNAVSEVNVNVLPPVETNKTDPPAQVQAELNQEKEKEKDKEDESEEGQAKKAAAEELARQVFEIMDVEHNGDLSWRELEKGLSNIDLDWTQIFKDIVTKKHALEKKIGRVSKKIATG